MEHPFLYAPGLHSTMQPRDKQELEQVFAFARVAFCNTVQARMLHRSLSSFGFSSYQRKLAKWGVLECYTSDYFRDSQNTVQIK